MKENKKFGLVPSLLEEGFLPNFFRPFSFWEDENYLSMLSHQRSNISISEDEHNVYIEALLPGVSEKNIEVTQDKNVLWIKGEAGEEKTDKNRKFYRKALKSFSYCVTLPQNIKESKNPQATYHNGVLEITYAKLPATEPKKIEITKKK